jgi:cytochrome c oxidase cbb3-type subunit II
MKFNHKKFEKNSILFLIATIVVISIGGLVEIVPLFRMETTIEPVKGVRPYTPLELAGFNIYLSEGCYNCHSQQIRPLRDEVERYGHYSLAAESMYDYPFQWGSKRTGPDLARVGGRYSDAWHVEHMNNPRDVVPESIMPAYSHLQQKEINLNSITNHMKALRKVGVPYSSLMIENAKNDIMVQSQIDHIYQEDLIQRYGEKINIRDFDGQKDIISQLDALIAYLQVLGTMAELTEYDQSILKVTDENK